MLKKIILIVFITITVTFLYFIVKLSLWTYHTRKILQEHKNIILIETDHKELLNECRAILQNPTTDTFIKETDWPLIIKKLRPSFVVTNNEREYIDIAIGGGFYMFGVIAYKDGVEVSLDEENENFDSYQYKQLIEGLWYYEE